MLNQDQITNFRLATSAHNNCGHEEDANLDDAYCSEDEVAQTRDSVTSFVEKWGQPSERQDYSFGTLLIWNDVQTRKGARRGDLFVMDFGDARGAYFSGQA